MDYQTLLATLLGGTILGSILTFLNTRRANKTAYMESVADTLSQLNDRLKREVESLQTQLETERMKRAELAVQLEQERQKRYELERRISAIERRTDGGT